ncbi:MAG: nucleotidyltransferase family protein, partial [Anaerolineales bacterium]
HRQGGLKNVPSGARVIPLINKVETVETLAAGRETALHLLGNLAVRAVMLGAVRRAEAEPVREVHGRVAALVLAAGRSTRMGQLKQILPWGEGSTIVAEVVRRLQASAVVEVVVVTGAGCEAVEAVLSTFTTPTAGNAAGPRVRLAFNPDFETSEMARSLQVGLSSLPEYSLAALVTLGDQPQLDPEVVQAILQRWRETQAPLVAPFFQGRRGHPLLFDRSVWPDLLTLPPEANPREILQKLAPPEPVEVISDSILRDIDTPGDYARERRIARFSG